MLEGAPQRPLAQHDAGGGSTPPRVERKGVCYAALDDHEHVVVGGLPAMSHRRRNLYHEHAT